MPLYERYGDNHEVVERVQTVAGSRNDARLASSKEWKAVDESAEATSTAPTPAAAAPLPKRTPKPAPAAPEG
ncbi:hypothetical protein [Streptomyces xantholiticus]|uniref:hypothetical protein n=1 Tax=Streptomyces xantholiticus TaxID=68285 RepID=UPI001677B8D3|nr:hypothetical protein [Streptomyces xantholiticus]GGW41334.1 hypothetical protein GCM10010381_27740 [Streptomyces xantholiticus]